MFTLIYFKAREYTRALNAVKLEKVFSKPFLFSLNQHTDGIKCLAKNTKSLVISILYYSQ